MKGIGKDRKWKVGRGKEMERNGRGGKKMEQRKGRKCMNKGKKRKSKERKRNKRKWKKGNRKHA